MRIPVLIALITALGFPLVSLGQGLGALFTNPEERAYLDYLRQDFLKRSAQAGFDIDQDEVPDIPEEVEEDEEGMLFHLGGIVTRRDGGRALWLNGRYVLESELPNDQSLVKADGITALRIATANENYVLKPGQTVDISTGEFWEAFEQPPRALVQQRVSSQESPSGGLSLSPQTVTTPLVENPSVGAPLSTDGAEELPIPLEFPQTPNTQ